MASPSITKNAGIMAINAPRDIVRMKLKKITKKASKCHNFSSLGLMKKRLAPKSKGINK
jgi:hypothetical protein